MDLHSGLVAFWDFGSPSGDRVSSAGDIHKLVDNSSVLADKGPRELGAKFSGSNHLSIANADAAPFKAPSAFSISCWFRTENLSGSGENLVSHFDLSGNQRGYWLVFEGTNNLLRFSVSSDGSTASGKYANVELTSVFADHSKELWKHAVATYEDNVAHLFINAGEQVGSASKTENGVHSSTADFNVGKDQGGRNLSGGISELGFWDRVLTDEEIRELYLHGLPAV